MASKKGMEAFARRNTPGLDEHAAQSGRQAGSYDDLKAAVPGPKLRPDRQKLIKNESQAMVNDRSHRSNEAGVEGRAPFYGTEAGSFDDTVTSHMAHADEESPGQYEETGQAMQTPAPDDHYAEGDLEQDDEMDCRNADEAEQGEFRQNFENDRGAQDQFASQQGPPASMIDGNKLGPMKGDSYPPSTSGQPSTAGINEGEAAVMDANVYSQGQPTGIPVRGHGTRANAQTAGGGPAATTQSRPTRPPPVDIWANQLAHDTHAPQQDQITDLPDASASVAHPHLAPTGPPTNYHQDQPSTNVGVQRPSKAAQRDALIEQPRPRQEVEHISGRGKTANSSIPRAQPGPEPKRKSKTRQVSHTAPPDQQHDLQDASQQAYHPSSVDQPSVTNQDQQQPTPASETQEARARAPSGSASSDQSPVLDYSEKDLSKKTYKELKEESFDKDPLLEPSDQIPKSATLEEKMAAVVRMPPAVQQNLIATLTLEEWEDAGDWFLQRYAEIAKKFKDARREKRKVAQAFEDEIEQRQREVSRKQEATLDALSAMRQTGGKVLEGTPKKTKKRN